MLKDAIEKGRVEGINSFKASKEFQNELVEFSEGGLRYMLKSCLSPWSSKYPKSLLIF